MKAETMHKMCLGKRVYYSLTVAEKALVKAQKERGQKLRIYTCPICGGLHITKQTEERNKP